MRSVPFCQNQRTMKNSEILVKICFIEKSIFFQQSCFRVHFVLSNTGSMHRFLTEFLLTGYCSFYKSLSADLPNCDFHTLDNFLSFQKYRFFADFPRFKPLKISFFQIEISITMSVSFNEFLSVLCYPKKRCVVLSAFRIQPNCLIYLKLLLT